MGPLSPSDLERIHAHALELLGTVGVALDHDAVRQALLRAGAEEGADGRARLPAGMVRDALAAAPKQVVLASVAGERTALTATGPTVFWSGNALHLTDRTGRREMTSALLADLVRVLEALEHVHAPVAPSIADFPPHSRDFVGFRILAENSRKHLRPCVYTPSGPLTIYEMAQVLLGGRSFEEFPVFSLGYTAISPLRWSQTALELFRATAGKRIPMMVNAEPLAGATAPVTLAGSVTQGHAEALSGFVVLQTLEPGRPCVYNLGFAHPFDMRSLISLTGSVECGLHAAAGAQLAQCLNLPCASWMSTESCVPDAQAGLEKTMTGLQHALAGVNIIWGIGQLDSQQALSMEMAVMDNDIAGQLKRLQQGIPVTEETLALGLVREMAPTGRFMMSDHTLAHYREQVHYPTVVFRGQRGRWEAEGAKDMVERAHDVVADILRREPEPVLTDDQQTAILDLQERRLQELAGG